MHQKLNITELKKKLEKERALLEGELRSLGRVNPENPEDWEAVPSDLNIPEADRNEVADKVEDFEEKMATESELEVRLRDVKKALEKIGRGAYGVCEIGGEPIEPERLSANPAARTCKKHLG